MAAVGANKITNGREERSSRSRKWLSADLPPQKRSEGVKDDLRCGSRERQQRSVTKRLTVAGSNPAKRKHRRAGLDTSHDVHAPKF